MSNLESPRKLPDVSHEVKPTVLGPIEKVGMDRIEMPIKISLLGEEFKVPAQISAYVSLEDHEAKGIHMSRLYLTLQEFLNREQISVNTVRKLLKEFVNSQNGLSESSYFKALFDLPIQRKALVSGKEGWRQYPVFVEGVFEEGNFEFILGVQIAYSSTCPCSAALAKQLIKESFQKNFTNEETLSKADVIKWLEKGSLAATPHAQRSYADIKLKFKDPDLAPSFLELIDKVEGSLKTPVQSAVKREDEQEFARLNAQNLMFCEDAARHIKGLFDQEKNVSDYSIRVEHQESLHPHNAVSVVVKGVEKGFHV